MQLNEFLMDVISIVTSVVLLQLSGSMSTITLYNLNGGIIMIILQIKS